MLVSGTIIGNPTDNKQSKSLISLPTNAISSKLKILHLGCDLTKMKCLDNIINDIPIILWNHRWEYDKNPEDFFKCLKEIQSKNIDFQLVILGVYFAS